MYLLLENAKPLAAYKNISDIQTFINKLATDLKLRIDQRTPTVYWLHDSSTTVVYRIIQLNAESVNNRLQVDVPYYESTP